MPRGVRAWYERVVTLDGRLSGRQRRERELLLFVVAAICVFALLNLACLRDKGERIVVIADLAFLVTTSFTILAAGCCGYHFRKSTISWYILLLVASLCIGDLHARPQGDDSNWPIFIIIIDLILVLRLSERLATCVVSFVVLWVLLMASESSFRMGIFDLPTTTSQDYRKERHANRYSCTEDLPCTRDDAFVYSMAPLFVFLADFVVTRGFSRQVAKEEAAMRRSIDTVQRIADLLAGYDVDAVASMLDETQNDIPEGIHATLCRMEANLRVYRPYLPMSCVPGLVRDVVPTSDTSSHRVTDTSLGSATLSAPPTALPLVKVSATILVANIKSTLSQLEDDSRSFSTLFGTTLDAVIGHVTSNRGVVDLFVGDRMLCAFNAARPCVTHSRAAGFTALDLLEVLPHTINIGISSGKVLCGDMGCTAMRRFGLLGRVPLRACSLERAGRAMGVDLVCCEGLEGVGHEMRLIPRLLVIVKAGKWGGLSCTEQRMYHLVGSTRNTPAEEWLYELDRLQQKWGGYNEAVLEFLNGGGYEAAFAAAEGTSSELGDEISALKGKSLALTVHM